MATGSRVNRTAGIGFGTVYARDDDYFAPVTAHFGYNNVAQYDASAIDDPSKLIGGCTFEDPDKIVFIDELDEIDNVNVRMEETKKYRKYRDHQARDGMDG